MALLTAAAAYVCPFSPTTAPLPPPCLLQKTAVPFPIPEPLPLASAAGCGSMTAATGGGAAHRTPRAVLAAAHTAFDPPKPKTQLRLQAGQMVAVSIAHGRWMADGDTIGGGGER